MGSNVVRDTSYKYELSDGRIVRTHPAVRKPVRISPTRIERLKVLCKMFKDGKAVQDIAKETGWEKHKIYQEMYNLKKLGMLPADFKNPSSKWFDSVEALVVELEKE